MSYYTFRDRRRVYTAFWVFFCVAFVTAVLIKPLWSQTMMPLPAASLVSHYLVALYAEQQYDYEVVIQSYRKAYESDPDNLDLLQRTLMFEILNGELEFAIPLAQRMIRYAPDHYLSRLILAVRALRSREYNTARRHLSYMDETDNLISLSVHFLTAWIAHGHGETDLALSILSDAESKYPMYSYYAYHAALIADLADRPAEAEIWFQKTHLLDSGIFRILDAYGRFLIRQNNTEKTRKFFTEFDRLMPLNPFIAKWQNDISVGKRPKAIVNDTRMGVAESLYTLGIMTRSTSKELAAIYFRLALYLNPDSSFPLISLADIYDDWEQYSIAASLYAQVSEESVLKRSVEIKRASNYVFLQKPDQAIAILRDIIKRYPDSIRAAVVLGGIYMDKELFEQAVSVYSPMIHDISKTNPHYWQLLYWRGVAYERSEQWKKAEIDLISALEFRPHQPQILNYLGYSLVDRGLQLDKAMKLLQEAVNLAPEDGHIVDSLGWCHYKLKHYNDAVRELERAIELKPGDSLINDHLGDAYWHVGRYLEARYQWSHALKMEPRTENEVILKIKLSKGLVDGNASGKF